jgi:SulP family sulfate permease
MAYGAIVFVGLGQDYVSFGVTAGLTALALGNLVSAFLGGVRIMCAGPYAMSSLMLSAAVTLLVSQGATGSPDENAARVVVLLFFIVLLAGALQTLFGLSKLGDLAKYIPYPVIAGLANAIAILIFVGQIRPMLGLEKEISLFDVGSVLAGFQPLTLLIGAITVGAILLGPKVIQKIPGAIVGIGVGTGLYYLLFALGYRDVLGPLIGSIPFSIPMPGFALEFASLIGDESFPSTLLSLLPLALGVAVVSSLRTLLAAVTLDNVTRSRSNTSRELVAQGCGNMVSALCGGVAVAGYSGQPLASYQNGGRSLRSRFVGGAFAFALHDGRPLESRAGREAGAPGPAQLQRRSRLGPGFARHGRDARGRHLRGGRNRHRRVGLLVRLQDEQTDDSLPLYGAGRSFDVRPQPRRVRSA